MLSSAFYVILSATFLWSTNCFIPLPLPPNKSYYLLVSLPYLATLFSSKKSESSTDRSLCFPRWASIFSKSSSAPSASTAKPVPAKPASKAPQLFCLNCYEAGKAPRKFCIARDDQSSRDKHRRNQHGKDGKSVKLRFAGSGSKAAREASAKWNHWKEVGKPPFQTKRPRIGPSPSTSCQEVAVEDGSSDSDHDSSANSPSRPLKISSSEDESSLSLHRAPTPVSGTVCDRPISAPPSAGRPDAPSPAIPRGDVATEERAAPSSSTEAAPPVLGPVPVRRRPISAPPTTESPAASPSSDVGSSTTKASEETAAAGTQEPKWAKQLKLQMSDISSSKCFTPAQFSRRMIM